MQITDPAAQLFDLYTRVQLISIAEHNNIQFRRNATKLNIAKAITDQAGDTFEIPANLPIAQQIRSSRLHAHNIEKRNEFKDSQKARIREQLETTLGEEEARKTELYQRISRFGTPQPETSSDEKIAVYSNRNISWDRTTLSKGYNFMTREEASKWLRLRGVREANPEEVAAYFDIA